MNAPAGTEQSPNTPLREWKRGWPVVLAAALGYGTGGAMIMLHGSLFIKPMREALGWTTSAVTILPIVTLVWALCNPLAGAAIDRFGSRNVALLGILGMAACAVALGAAPAMPLGIYGIAALMGVCSAMTSVATYARGVADWFDRSLGLAIGIALSGSAAIALVGTPLIGFVIAQFGWRSGFFALAGLILMVALPTVALLYREREVNTVHERRAQTAASGEFRGVVLDKRFWCYTISFTLACLPVSGTIGHLQPILAEKGFSLAQALSLGMVYAVAISTGKILGGFFLDRAWPFAVAAVICLLASAGMITLMNATSSTPSILVALMTAAIGLASGAEADFIGFFIRRSFGMRVFSTIVGIMAMIVTFGVSAGIWLYGFLFDLYGDYDLAMQFGTLCLVASAAIILLAGYFERGMDSITPTGERVISKLS